MNACTDSSGSTFTEMNGLLRMARIKTISEHLYYDYQATYVLPAIQQLYEASIHEARQQIVESGRFLVHHLSHTSATES